MLPEPSSLSMSPMREGFGIQPDLSRISWYPGPTLSHPSNHRSPGSCVKIPLQPGAAV